MENLTEQKQTPILDLQIGKRRGLILLNGILIAVSCISLVYVAHYYSDYYISFRPSGVPSAIVLIAAFAVISVLFAFAGNSFGYVVGFYSYAMLTGYLWLNSFSELIYNHRLAGLSAAASAIVFLLPALFISAPVRQVYALSLSALDRLLTLILLLSLATILVGASYSFKFVSIENIYNHRHELGFPVFLNYVIGLTSNALLPFAFACFVGRGNIWRAGAALFLLLLFYPITLSKLALFTPFWLVAMLALSRYFDFKLAVTLSLLVPISVGLLLIILYQQEILPSSMTMPYFGLVNFRMIAIPSLAMDYYNSFFFNHPVTNFCQIGLLKPFVACPYQEQLANVIYNAFGIGGQFNASLFATEGIASVGALFAPVTAFAAGLVIAIGNRLSAGLQPQFILISGAILAQALLNVPLTTVLLTHGAGVLFVLWYITPRDAFGVTATAAP
ncbi:hypothetical protein [Bradyrhizobium jicamae]|uniref:hypothetical protein n=1 Tax=Bradyrhizobium jicamae TaxID=280332 RepID=UPI0012EDA8A5|nr:hypothetical protein [Bradyrhizobium jicamae]